MSISKLTADSENIVKFINDQPGPCTIYLVVPIVHYALRSEVVYTTDRFHTAFVLHHVSFPFREGLVESLEFFTDHT